MAPFVSFLEKERLANKQARQEAQQVKQEAEQRAEWKTREAEQKAEQENQDAKQIIAALLQIAQNKSNPDLDIDKVMAQAQAFLDEVS